MARSKKLDPIPSILKRLDILEASKSVELISQVSEVPKEAPKNEPSDLPVPQEYREIVDTVLNKEFGVRYGFGNEAGFEFTVIVPRKYSNAPKEHFILNGEDCRVRIVPHAEAERGVQSYVDKIWENLGPDMRALITAAR